MKLQTRHKSLRGIFVLALAGVMLCAVPASADTLSDLQQQQSDIQSNKQTNQSQLNATNAQINDLQAEIDSLDDELNTTENQLSIINDTLDSTNAALAQTQIDLQHAEDQRDTQLAAMKSRIRYMYENGQAGYLEVILESTSFSDFLNRVEYMNRIMKYDTHMAANLKAAETSVSDKLDQTQKQKDQIEVLQYEQTNKQQALQTSLDKKADAMNALDATAEGITAKLALLDQSDKNVTALIQQAEAEAAAKAAAERAAAEKAAADKAAADRAAAAAAAVQAAAQNNTSGAQISTTTQTYSGSVKLIWPVPSSRVITDTYRSRINPVTGKSEFHTGIDIGCASGTPVVAAADGTVIFSGANGGYGNCVIIDHGGGLSTLYAHASKLLVSKGDTVTQGQTIDLAGATGVATGPHCHFEVRINGATTNPLLYVKP